MVEVSRLSVESGQGEELDEMDGWIRPDCNIIAAPDCFISRSLATCCYTWIPCFVPSRHLVYVHQMAHGSLLGLDLLTSGHLDHT